MQNGSAVKGKQTMTDLMQLVKERAEQHGVKNIVVPTKESGNTVKRVLEALGTEYHFYAVGNPSTSHDRGFCLHKGITEEKRKELEALGITVILEDQSITQAWAVGGQKRLINGKFFDLWGKARERNVPLDVLIENISSEGKYNLLLVLVHAMEWFGEAGRVCIECALMAADSGLLPLDELCIVIATPVDPNVPDACMVLSPAKTVDVLTWKFGVTDFTQVLKSKS